MAKRPNGRPPHTECGKPEMWEIIINKTFEDYEKYLKTPQDAHHYRRKRFDYISSLKSEGLNSERMNGGLSVTDGAAVYTAFSDYCQFLGTPQEQAQYKRKCREYMSIIEARLKEACAHGRAGNDCGAGTADGSND